MEFSWILEPEAEYDVLDNRHDKGYKYLLQSKRIFVQLLRSFVNQGWVRKIEEDSLERIEKSFVLQDFREKEADIVYKVKLDGREVFFYILLELQSTVDYQMPYRLLQYMLEIWRAVLKDTGKRQGKRKEFKLPVIVPFVLYNGKDNWTACKSFRETLEESGIFGEYILDFKYILFDVKRYDENKLLEMANVIGSAFFVDQKPDSGELVERLKKLALHLEDMSEEDFGILRTWVKHIIMRGIPEEKANEIEGIIDRVKEANEMVYALEEALKSKFKDVRQEGKMEGRLEGRIEGKVEGRIEAILDLLEELGDIPEGLEKTIRSETSIETLRIWFKQAARAGSIEEFKEKTGLE